MKWGMCKKTQGIGAFSICRGKHPVFQAFSMPKSKRAAAEIRRGPSNKAFMDV
jgi:hypothetical protein